MTHFVDKDLFVRVNTALLFGVVGGGLVLSALGAAIIDIGRWLNAW